MKRFLLLATSVLVALSLVSGCDRTEKKVETTKTTEVQQPANTNTQTPAQ